MCLVSYLKRCFYLSLQPFCFLFLSTSWSDVCPNSFQSLIFCHSHTFINEVFFRWATFSGTQWGAGKPRPQRAFPILNTSLGEPAVPHVIIADSGEGGEGRCVRTAGTICYSLIHEEWQVSIVFILSLLHCDDSFPRSPEQDMVEFFLFVWRFLLLLLAWLTLFSTKGIWLVIL